MPFLGSISWNNHLIDHLWVMWPSVAQRMMEPSLTAPPRLYPIRGIVSFPCWMEYQGAITKGKWEELILGQWKKKKKMLTNAMTSKFLTMIHVKKSINSSPTCKCIHVWPKWNFHITVCALTMCSTVYVTLITFHFWKTNMRSPFWVRTCTLHLPWLPSSLYPWRLQKESIKWWAP